MYLLLSILIVNFIAREKYVSIDVNSEAFGTLSDPQGKGIICFHLQQPVTEIPSIMRLNEEMMQTPLPFLIAICGFKGYAECSACHVTSQC